MHRSVGEGGCWFCEQDQESEDLYSEREFDTFVHMSCLRLALERYDDEAEFMIYLLPEAERKFNKEKYELRYLELHDLRDLEKDDEEDDDA